MDKNDDRGNDFFLVKFHMDPCSFFNQTEEDINKDFDKYLKIEKKYQRLKDVSFGIVLVGFISIFLILLEEDLVIIFTPFQPLLTLLSFILIIVTYAIDEYMEHNILADIIDMEKNLDRYLSFKKILLYGVL